MTLNRLTNFINHLGELSWTHKERGKKSAKLSSFLVAKLLSSRYNLLIQFKIYVCIQLREKKIESKSGRSEMYRIAPGEEEGEVGKKWIEIKIIIKH